MALAVLMRSYSAGTHMVVVTGLDGRSPQPWMTFKSAHKYTSTERPLFGMSGRSRRVSQTAACQAGSSCTARLTAAESAGAPYSGRCMRACPGTRYLFEMDA
jgi:hypothetical protein